MSKKDSNILGMALFLGLVFIVAAGHKQMIDFAVNVLGPGPAFVIIAGPCMLGLIYTDRIVSFFTNLKVATKEDEQ